MASMCASYNSKCISLVLSPSLSDFNCKVQSEMASLPDSVKEAGCQVRVVACVCVCVLGGGVTDRGAGEQVPKVHSKEQ